MAASAWKTRETLLERIKNPLDENSWEDFVRYYQPFIYGVVRGMRISHHDAEEIVQTILLKAWKKLPDFEYDRGRGRFRGWLCQVTGNAVRDFIRRRRPDMGPGVEQIDEQTQLAGVSQPEVDRLAEKEWRRHVSDLAWARVKERFQPRVAEAFLLTVQGVPVAEIMQRLELAESSVYVYKGRVQKELRAEIIRINRALDS